ncbi:MAG: exo-alpha-sialidase [Acidobacteria bacterium]|nr:exo-alpha-sialidase [Acidobacteriota bacterium]
MMNHETGRLTRRMLLGSAPLMAQSASPVPELVELRRIWGEAPHSAFTDLVRFRDRWFCTFREGQGHAGDHGAIRIITSADAKRWESAASLQETGTDLRDPKLSVMPDGRLMAIMGGAVYEGRTYATRAPRVSFSPDGYRWSTPQRLLAEDHWLWRVTWHKGRAYSLSKLNEGPDAGRRGFLYGGSNGIDWQWITEFKAEGVSETTIRFLPDEEAIALVRPWWTGSSRPPYKQWTFHKMPVRMGGPNFLAMPDGRMWSITGNYLEGGRRTVLGELTRNSYRPVLTLPSGGDNSYAGMVWHDGLLWASYYSSHEEKTCIYMAVIRFR